MTLMLLELREWFVFQYDELDDGRKTVTVSLLTYSVYAFGKYM